EVVPGLDGAWEHEVVERVHLVHRAVHALEVALALGWQRPVERGHQVRELWRQRWSAGPLGGHRCPAAAISRRYCSTASCTDLWLLRMSTSSSFRGKLDLMRADNIDCAHSSRFASWRRNSLNSTATSSCARRSDAFRGGGKYMRVSNSIRSTARGHIV